MPIYLSEGEAAVADLKERMFILLVARLGGEVSISKQEIDNMTQDYVEIAVRDADLVLLSRKKN